MLVCLGCGLCQSMVRLGKEDRVAHIARRPAVLAPPFTGNVLQVRIWRVPVLHINDQPGIVQHAGVSSLEPVIPPADGLSAPLDLRAGDGVMWKGVVPRSDNRLQRGLRLLQHVGDAVAIAVEQAADNKTGNLDLAVRAHRASPERTVMLMFEIEQRPGRSVEARA